MIEFSNELLLETLSPKTLIELSVEQQVDKPILALKKSHQVPFYRWIWRRNRHCRRIWRRRRWRRRQIRDLLMPNAYQDLSAIRMELYYVFLNKNKEVIPPVRREGALLLTMTKEEELMTELLCYQLRTR